MTFATRTATLLSAAALALATPLAAQQAQPADVPPAIAAEDVTDAEVAAFVDAILAVDAVRSEYGPRITAAEDEAAQQALVEEANAAAAAALEGVDNMDIDRYVAIADAASNNDALNQRIIARITELRQQ